MAGNATRAPKRVGPAQRREQITRLITRQGPVDVDHLAGVFDVTASTIRRDLSVLTASGDVTRTYGGAMARPRAAEASVGQRSGMALREKEAIARTAATFVEDGETIILDAGTTVGRLATRLRTRPGLTVITNGMTALAELADVEELHVICLGGDLRSISKGFVGPLAELVLTRLTADRVFLGADSLDARLGICEANPAQTRLKELMMSHADRVYVLADSSKLGHAAFDAWAPVEKPWTLITDGGATDAQLAPFRDRADARVIVADDPDRSDDTPEGVGSLSSPR
jgi:DeoR/GlpR family transcriptional regulator of sugar metabolism